MAWLSFSRASSLWFDASASVAASMFCRRPVVLRFRCTRGGADGSASDVIAFYYYYGSPVAVLAMADWVRRLLHRSHSDASVWMNVISCHQQIVWGKVCYPSQRVGGVLRCSNLCLSTHYVLRRVEEVVHVYSDRLLQWP